MASPGSQRVFPPNGVLDSGRLVCLPFAYCAVRSRICDAAPSPRKPRMKFAPRMCIGPGAGFKEGQHRVSCTAQACSLCDRKLTCLLPLREIGSARGVPSRALGKDRRAALGSWPQRGVTPPGMPRPPPPAPVPPTSTCPHGLPAPSCPHCPPDPTCPSSPPAHPVPDPSLAPSRVLFLCSAFSLPVCPALQAYYMGPFL